MYRKIFVVGSFHFGCKGLDMETVWESVKTIENWVEENGVMLFTDDYCSFNTSAKLVDVLSSSCKGAKIAGGIIWNYLGILVILYCTMGRILFFDSKFSTVLFFEMITAFVSTLLQKYTFSYF